MENNADARILNTQRELIFRRCRVIWTRRSFRRHCHYIVIFIVLIVFVAAVLLSFHCREHYHYIYGRCLKYTFSMHLQHIDAVCLQYKMRYGRCSKLNQFNCIQLKCTVVKSVY